MASFDRIAPVYDALKWPLGPGAIDGVARGRGRVRRAGLENRVAFRRGGVETLERDERFDLIVTPFVLDLFGPRTLTRTMERLDRALVPGGSWLFADFALDLSGPVGRAVVAALCAFFGVVCGVEARALPDCDGAFARLGYACALESRRVGGLLVGRVYRRP